MRYTQKEPSNLVISSHTLITGDAIVEIASCTLQERELCRVCVCVRICPASKTPVAVFTCPRHPIDPNLAM